MGELQDRRVPIAALLVSAVVLAAAPSPCPASCNTPPPVPSAAATSYTSDIGSIDKPTLQKVYPSKPGYSPYAGRTFPTMPLFGDTHLRTAFSMDAGAFGARLTEGRVSLRAALEITSNSGLNGTSSGLRRA